MPAASSDTLVPEPLAEPAASTPKIKPAAEPPASVRAGKKAVKLLAEQEQPEAEEIQTPIKAPPLSASSKKYLERMNRLLDEELRN